MAKTAPRSSAAAEIRPTDIGPRAAKAAKRIAELKAQREHARALAHQAQVREALARSELTQALTQTLKALCVAESATRRAAAALYTARRPAQPLHPPSRADRWRRAAWLRLGAKGEARLLMASGLWRTHDLDAAVAYVARGPDPAAQPASLFDQGWYLARYPEAVGYGRAPLTHYLLHGAARGFSPHPLFDPLWYREQNDQEMGGANRSPLAHFLLRGAALGRNPHPLFDLAHYVGQGPDLAPGEDPLSHYMRQGWREGLWPHPLFDPEWYRRQAKLGPAEIPPLLHYVTEGWRQRLSPHALFDAAWYIDQNPDVAEADKDPLAHFVTSGGAEGRNPSPWFDIAHYAAARGEDLAPGANPLVDYLQGGAWAVAEARPGLPTAAYLAATPEIVAQGVTPLEHWARKAAPS